MTRQYENRGRDQINVENLYLNITARLNPEFPSIESQEIPPVRKVINYIAALLFLVAVLCWWFLLNLFTKCTFPFKRIFALILASLALMPAPSKDNKYGLNVLWHEIEQQCKEKLNLARQDLEIGDNSQQEYSRFNEQASEVWLLKRLIKILISGSKNENQEINKVLEILQKQEDCISLNLRQLRKILDPDLEKVQGIWNKVKGPAIETDYERINAVLNSLVYKFTLSSKPSQEQAENLIEELRQIIVDNPHNIDISRIGTLHSVLQLLKWIAATGYTQPFEYEFKAEVDSVRKQRAIEIIIEQMTAILRSTLENISTNALDSIELGIRKQWIGEIMIYGFNSKNLAVVELALEIDWNKFNAWRNYAVSDGMVKVTWGTKVPAEVGQMVERFNEFLEKSNLSADWRVDYSPGIDEERASEINEILGFRNSPVHWNEQTIEAKEEKVKVQNLSELGIGLYFKPRKYKQYS